MSEVTSLRMQLWPVAHFFHSVITFGWVCCCFAVAPTQKWWQNEKKWTTGQSCIRKEVASYKTHTLTTGLEYNDFDCLIKYQGHICSCKYYCSLWFSTQVIFQVQSTAANPLVNIFVWIYSFPLEVQACAWMRPRRAQWDQMFRHS